MEDEEDDEEDLGEWQKCGYGLGVYVLGFGVYGFGVYGSGFTSSGLEFGVRVSGTTRLVLHY